ncbi:MAG: maleylpyruvate isomerase N-terminal domain-containing protein, partial [Actinobacteria bacterium]|nr:maleylpyruvate isomerase N-terminal domain-containing protein [Actinomycetota bacterium]
MARGRPPVAPWRAPACRRHAEGMTYEPCDVAFHVSHLRRDGELLAAAAGRAGLGTDVPGCPAWRVRDLLTHVGFVHRWATGIVRDRLSRPAGGGETEQEMLRNGPADRSLPGWFADGHASLVRTLAAADPGLTCWTFLEAASPLAFWARRQAHETAIHRADAQQAARKAGAGDASAGDASAGGEVAGEAAAGDAVAGEAVAGDGAGAEPSFEPRFAADGIDELIMGFASRNIRRGRWHGPAATLAICADDGPAGRAGWLVTGGPDGAGVARGTGPADCTVTGPAASLYLLLWNRDPGS